MVFFVEKDYFPLFQADLAETAIREKQARLAQAFPYFLEGQRKVGANPFFSLPVEFPKAADAGPYLNPRLSWQGEDGGVLPARMDSLEISEDLIQELKTWGAKWIYHGDDVDLSGFSFDWLKELGQFRYWDLDGYASNLQSGPVTVASLLRAPMPANLMILRHWAVLRMLKALQSKAGFDEALSEIRHLAALAYSTENTVGAVVALQLLKVEGEGTILFQKINPTFQPSNPSFSSDDISAAMGLIVTFPNFLRPLAAPEMGKRLVSEARLGICAALFEAAAQELPRRALIRAVRPDAYVVLEDALRGQSGCRLSFVRQLWADGALDEQFLSSGQALVPQIGQEKLEKDYAMRSLLSLQKYLFRIPAFRRWVGRMVLAQEEIDLRRLPGLPSPAPAGK